MRQDMQVGSFLPTQAYKELACPSNVSLLLILTYQGKTRPGEGSKPNISQDETRPGERSKPIIYLRMVGVISRINLVTLHSKL